MPYVTVSLFMVLYVCKMVSRRILSLYNMNKQVKRPMRVEVDEPAREMHRQSGSSWRAVMPRVSGEKLRGNPAPRSPGDDDMGGLILMYTYHHLCLNPRTRKLFKGQK